MRQIVAINGEPVVIDVPVPELRPGEILVDTTISTVSSGTELLILGKSGEPDAVDAEYPGEGPYQRPAVRSWVGPSREPREATKGRMSLGYSLAGTVVAVDPTIDDLSPGDVVACAGSQCSHHADTVAVPRNLMVPVPDRVDLASAAFVTPGAVSVEAIRRTGCHFGETIVIQGLGLLGIMGLQVARSAGLYPIGFEPDPRRRALANSLGFTEVFDPFEVDPETVVCERTNGFGADASVLALVTESSEPINLAFRMTRRGGRVVGLGVFGMNLERSVVSDRTYVHAIAYGAGRYDPSYEEGNVDYPINYARWTENRNMAHFLRLIAEGQMDVSSLAATYRVDDAAAGYTALRNRTGPPTVQFTYT